MSGDWAGRAGTVEDVIRRRFVRRLGGLVPGTRLGRVRWPRPLLIRPWPWHYWWQAHLLGLPCRRPPPRATAVAGGRDRRADPNSAAAQLRLLDQRLLRRHRRARPGRTARRATGPAAPRPPSSALAAVTDRLRAGLYSRRRRRHLVAPRGTTSKRPRQRSGPQSWPPAPATWSSPPRSRLDRGHPDDPQTGLVRDGVRLNPDGTIRTVEATTYTRGGPSATATRGGPNAPPPARQRERRSCAGLAGPSWGWLASVSVAHRVADPGWASARRAS